MSSDVKIYKIKDFIRKKDVGEIDCDRAVEIAKELASAVAFNPDRNVLLDLRETTLSNESFSELFKAAQEIVPLKPVFDIIGGGKIANLVPDDAARLLRANVLKSFLQIQGFRYEVFTDYEEAIEWLSETKKKK